MIAYFYVMWDFKGWLTLTELVYHIINNTILTDYLIKCIVRITILWKKTEKLNRFNEIFGF